MIEEYKIKKILSDKYWKENFNDNSNWEIL